MSSEKDLFDAIENFDKQINWDELKKDVDKEDKKTDWKKLQKDVDDYDKKVHKTGSDS